MMEGKKSILIKPFSKPCNARVEIPGSKSISNRALILSSMCHAEVELNGLLVSEDVDLMRKALTTLGFTIQQDGNSYKILGTGGIIPKKECLVNVGNAGTIARFLTCFLASQKNGIYSMDGTEAMRKRPMLELMNCLSSLGAVVEYQKDYGCFPFRFRTNGFKSNKIIIDATKSGQNISGILMQCPLLQSDCEITFSDGTVSLPFVKMTLEMMRSFTETNHLDYSLSESRIILKNASYKKSSFTYDIEPDATAASYFITLPQVVGGICEISGMHGQMLQGDIAFSHVLNSLGANLDFDINGISSKSTGKLTGGTFDFVDISDTFLTLAAISPLLNGSLQIYGIEHTRKQETDRVSAMSKELIKLGQDVEEHIDRLIIHPNLNKLRTLAMDGVEINTYNDHRFAMSFAILGCFDLFGDGRSWLKINNPGCCAKTFPLFFNCLDSVRTDSFGK